MKLFSVICLQVFFLVLNPSHLRGAHVEISGLFFRIEPGRESGPGDEEIEITRHPESRRVCENTEVTLSVQITSPCDVEYQWYNGNDLIEGANESQLTIIADEGNNNAGFYVEITGACGSVKSDVATLALIPKPEITGSVLHENICPGADYTFSVTASNASSYAWYKEGILIHSGASFTVENADAADEGYYRVVVKGNEACAYETEEGFSVFSRGEVEIRHISPSVTLCEGMGAEMLVEYRNGVSHKWYKNGVFAPEMDGNWNEIVNPADGDSYYAVIEGYCNTDTTDISTITVKKNPVITSFVEEQQACAGASYTFSVTAMGAVSYRWYKGETFLAETSAAGYTLNTISASDAGIYRVEVEGEEICGSPVISSQATLSLSPEVSVSDIAGQTELCSTGSTTLQVTATGGSILWYRNEEEIAGETSPALEIAAPADGDRYYAQVTGACNTVYSDTVALRVHAPVVITVGLGSAAVCAGASHTFSVTATGADRYRWYKGETFLTETTSGQYTLNTISTQETGLYRVEIYGPEICGEPLSSQATLSLSAEVSVSDITGQMELCSTGSTTLQVTATGGSILWYRNEEEIAGETSPALEIAAPADGDRYYAQVTGACNTVYSDTVALRVHAPVVITVGLGSAAVCAGASHTFSVTATGAERYRWYKGETFLTETTSGQYTVSNISALETGLYRVEIYGTEICGEPQSSQATLSLSPDVSVSDITGQTELCSTGSTTLQVTATGGSILWYRNGAEIAGQTSQTLEIAGPSEGGRYYAQVTGACNTVYSDTVALRVHAPVVITAGLGSVAVCAGASHTFSITATGAVSYRWYKGETFLEETTAGQYTVNNISASDAGVYKVEIYGPEICGEPLSSQATLSLSPEVSVSDVTGQTELCSTGSTTLQVTATGGSILWYRNDVEIAGQTSPALEIAAPADGDRYYAQVTGACNTVYSDTVALRVHAPVVITVGLGSAAVCAGASHTFSVTATGAERYRWYKDGTPLGETTTGQYTVSNISALETGVYRVEVYGVEICGEPKSSEATLSLSAEVSVSDISGITELCSTGSTTLQVEATGGSILWYRNEVQIAGQTSAVLEISGPVNGDVYHAQVTGECNTVYSAKVSLRVHAPAVITAGLSNAEVCAGASHTFSVTATGAVSYRWYKGETFLTETTSGQYTVNTISTQKTGLYRVEIYGPEICGEPQSSEATLSLSPEVSVSDITGQTELCSTGSTTLQVTATGGSILWYRNEVQMGGQTSPALEIAAPADGDRYHAQVTGECNTVYSAKVSLRVHAPVVITSGLASAEVCGGASHTFSVTATGAVSYLWYKGETFLAETATGQYIVSNISALETGLYRVEIYGAEICGEPKSSKATLSLSPEVSVSDISGITELCSTGSTTLQVEATGGSILWYRNEVQIAGQTSAVLEISGPVDGDVYHAQVTGACNTVYSDTVALRVHAPAVMTAGLGSAAVCAGASHTFSVTATGAVSYRWYKGETFLTETTAGQYTVNTISIQETGLYRVEIYGPEICGEPLSSKATLSLSPEVSVSDITGQTELCSTGSTTLQVTATGGSIRWYRNEVQMEGQTSSALAIAAPADGDRYYAQVTGVCNTVYSDTVALRVHAPVVITAQSERVQMLEEGESVSLYLTVEGDFSEVLWYKNTILTAYRGTAVQINDVSEGDVFYAEVTGACNPVYSNEIVMKSTPAVLLTISSSQPQGICQNETAVLEVSGCTEELQWYFGNAVAGSGSSLEVSQPGVYTVHCLKSSVVIASDSMEVKGLLPLTYFTSSANVSCFGGNDGSISIESLAAGVQIQWLSHPQFTGSSLNGLTAGNYSFQLSGGGGCPVEYEVQITQPQPLQLSLEQILSPKGSNSADGYIDIAVTGGTMPYSVTWTDASQNTHISHEQFINHAFRTQLSGVGGNQYTLSLTDAHQCGVTATYELKAPEPLVIHPLVKAVTCYGEENGQISITVEGGVKDNSLWGYQVAWKSGEELIAENTLELSGLKAGEYTVQITDSGGVTVSATLTVPEPPELILQIGRQADNYCNSLPAGEIDLKAQGGKAPYTYAVNGAPAHSPLLTGLPGGQYLLRVTDSEGCSAETSAVIANRTEDFKVNISYTAPTCYGACNGTLSALVSGGKAPYSYKWSDFEQEENTLQGICAGGEIFVTVTDANGCVLTSGAVELKGPQPMALPLPAEVEVCPSDFELDASSLTWGTKFVWTFPEGHTVEGSKVKGDGPGIYRVEVLDSNSCGGVAEIRVVAHKNVKLAFTMPSEAAVNREVAVIDLSEPYPEAIQWILPASARVSAQSDFESRIIFSQTGRFTVSQKATIGGCVYSNSKEILIRESLPDDGFNPPQSFTEIDFAVLGNPVTDGKLRLEMMDPGDRTYQVKVFTVSGFQKVFEGTYSRRKYIEIPLPEKSADGLFYVTVEAENSRKTRKVVRLK